MFISEDLEAVFNTKFSINSSEEKFDDAYFDFESNSFNLPTEQELKDLFEKIAGRDSFEITFQLGDTTSIVFQSTKQTAAELLKELNSQKSFYTEGEKVTIGLRINKYKVDSTISIYSFSSFVSFLQSLSGEQLLENFSDKTSNDQYLLFECFDIKEPFNTSSIHFLNSVDVKAFDISGFPNREDWFSKIISVSSFLNSYSVKLIPEDFRILRSSASNASLAETFNKALSLLLVSSLYDITSLSENTITYQLNGYKAIKGSLEIVAPLKSVKEYYEIYNWAFSGGNLADKIGLVRNIISLHLVKDQPLEISENTYFSILSSYKVYEKQNIKQYIEIRNKISDQLIEFNVRANKIIETFASGFQKSALALITFYFSAFAVKSFSSGHITNIFSNEVTALSVTFLVGSLIYYFVSRWEVNEQKTRFIDSYSNMKSRYTDLLTEDDIRKILNHDKEYNKDIEFITKKRDSYSALWMAYLTLLFISTMLLCFLYNSTC